MCAKRLFDGPLCCLRTDEHTTGRQFVRLCDCGCGNPTPIGTSHHPSRGLIAGQPLSIIRGHRRLNLDGRYRVTASGCWEWLGKRNNAGYGRIHRHGRVLQAHRVSFEAARGPIPDGLDLDHLCRNRLCINPDHLEPVTRGDNARRGHLAKLTDFEVAEIRASSLPTAALASHYGVNRSTVLKVRRRETWRAA